MRALAKLKPNEEQEFSITLTASVSDWRALIRQMDAIKNGAWYAWPASTLVSAIQGVISDLDKTYEKLSPERG